MEKGMVYFVGAGPGAVDLITVRGMELLRRADVIIYAGSLVNPELLLESRPGCEIHDSSRMTLEEVIAVMEQAEQGGKEQVSISDAGKQKEVILREREAGDSVQTLQKEKIISGQGEADETAQALQMETAEADPVVIVRLHTGDPAIYGAIREQMVELERRGISYEVCPGVSSFSGAAAALRMEYTLPELSQTVILTRMEGRTPVPEQEKLSALAAHQATMVLFLSAGHAGQVKQELLRGGIPPDTPAAVVYKATWPEEKVIRTTVEQLPQDMEKAGIYKTALIIVGRVLGEEFARSRLYDGTFETEYRSVAGHTAHRPGNTGVAP